MANYKMAARFCSQSQRHGGDSRVGVFEISLEPLQSVLNMKKQTKRVELELSKQAGRACSHGNSAHSATFPEGGSHLTK